MLVFFRVEDVQVAYGSMDQLWVDIATGESSNCCVRNFPHPKDVLAGFITVLKRREGKTRMMILMLIFNFACYIFAYNGTEGTHR